MLPAQDGLAVLRFLEATPPRTPQLQAQFAIFRAWANVQLTTVALRECLHQGSIGCTAVPSLVSFLSPIFQSLIYSPLQNFFCDAP